METLSLTTVALASATAALLLPKIHRRLQLSLAKHRSLSGHSRMAKRVASLVPGYAYEEARFFNCDGAPDEVVQRRRQGFGRLANELNPRHSASIALTQQTREG
ncbi:MAG TPA: glutamate-1-semialdehyde 2,1-aminomutase, partial [Hydrogenophaga sp.]